MELGVLLVPLFIFLIAVGAYFSHLKQKKRREELGLLAAELGWQFVPEKDYTHDEEYAHYEIFRHGHSRYAYNTLVGSLKIDDMLWPAKMGEFHYQTTSHSGKKTTTHTYQFSYLLLELPYMRVPGLLIRREGMFDAVKNLFGFDDIDFESAEFSRTFFVKSSDKRFAYDVIHPNMIEFLLAGDPLTIDAEQGRCCFSDGERIWRPDQFRTTLAWAKQFFELWPSHVVSQLEQRV